ncbi:MAG: hypothetical protein HY744_16320 [Deltaproteobacteria bacterium]|nr:hypothetical protein [Deltaproteobacteria bacterium]
MRRIAFLVLSAVLLAGGCVVTVESTPVGTVAADGSVYLGWTLISHKKEADWMLVGVEHGDFSSLRLHVTKAGLVLDRMVVAFGNGEQWNVPVPRELGQGAWSPEIKLPGARRIRKVTFFARTKGKGGLMAHVDLYGRR